MSNPTTKLTTGANTPLPSEETLTITVEWISSPAELDVSCFMVNEHGKVPSDDYFIFYNQPSDPQGHVRFEPLGSNAVKFTIKLAALLATPIQKCVLAATIDGIGTFSQVQGCKITAKSSGSEVVYEINEGSLETSLVLVELYRNQSWFKLRAVGRGFNGGLKPLAEAHGVVVEEEVPSSTAASDEIAAASQQAAATAANAARLDLVAEVPASPAPAIPVSQPKAQSVSPSAVPIQLTKIDLLKKKVKLSLEKKSINEIKARVAVVFDASGSMYDLYRKGTVQRAFEKVLAVAASMDDDGVMDVWFFASKSKRMPSVTEKDYEDYVNKTYPTPQALLGFGNDEPKVMEDIIKKYTKEEPSDLIPTYVIFFSDGGVYETKKISKLLIDSSKSSIFWQFVGLGRSGFGVLEKLDHLKGRFIDNANFFALSDLDKVSDEALYDRLFNEFPDWIRLAKEKRILR